MADDKLDFASIEKKWQEAWDKQNYATARDNDKKPKYYVLEMFPYPSGEGLHMGHAWNFALGDILARYKRLKGFNVLYPMGYDALGLPAENAAIKAGTHPEEYTLKSMTNFGKQQRAIGLSYDWDRLVATNEPEYYKWDQWIFLKMLEKGLAYQKESSVNWCSKCDTVLANEQVQNGVCWRHEDTKVETKKLKQWFFKITDYADELYESLNDLKDWPEKTKLMQKNWIGKSHGYKIRFDINGEQWPVFTTRPDTMFGVTFMVIAANHPRLSELVTEEQRLEVEAFTKKVRSVSEKELADLEKEGAFTGSYAINPANGEKIPVWTGNFVLAEYGSGMVMAVPGHDQRDWEFAKKYDLEIKQVIQGGNLDEGAHTQEGLLINSKEFDKTPSKDAIEKIGNWLQDKGVAEKTVNYKLRDWGISRQRYWGTPIPIIHCEDCGTVPVPEFDLPVELPKDVDFGKGNPLETNEEWLKVSCPACGKTGRRESDTMDTFVNSSWYFLRYCDPNNNEKIFDTTKVDYWNPIDTYIGGAEHACMHLIYARFYTKFLRDIGVVNIDEPITRMFHQGFIYGSDGHKMSKSRGNVIEPLETIKHYGADTLRFFMVSMASPDKDWDWDEKGFSGSSKLIKRIFSFSDDFTEQEDKPEVISKLHQTIKNVEEYYENIDYRKATIELRELFSVIEKQGSSKQTFEQFLQLLNPLCPHITEELWNRLGHEDLIGMSTWPSYDENKIVNQKNSSDINETVILDIKTLLDKASSRAEKIYVYVMPFEMDKIDEAFITAKFETVIEIFSTADKNKYDPQNKAKKARPGKPSLYFE